MRKPNKYSAIKKVVDNIQFDSRKEANRYSQLKLLLKANKITDLILQPRFDLIVNDVFIGYYKADFQYVENGETITEDVKGVETTVYRIKKKMVKAIYGIDIFET